MKKTRNLYIYLFFLIYEVFKLLWKLYNNWNLWYSWGSMNTVLSPLACCSMCHDWNTVLLLAWARTQIQSDITQSLSSDFTFGCFLPPHYNFLLFQNQVSSNVKHPCISNQKTTLSQWLDLKIGTFLLSCMSISKPLNISSFSLFTLSWLEFFCCFPLFLLTLNRLFTDISYLILCLCNGIHSSGVFR